MLSDIWILFRCFFFLLFRIAPPYDASFGVIQPFAGFFAMVSCLFPHCLLLRLFFPFDFYPGGKRTLFFLSLKFLFPILDFRQGGDPFHLLILAYLSCSYYFSKQIPSFNESARLWNLIGAILFSPSLCLSELVAFQLICFDRQLAEHEYPPRVCFIPFMQFTPPRAWMSFFLLSMYV